MARDLALSDAYLTSRLERKKAEMLFAYPERILKLDRLRLSAAPTEQKTSSTSPPPPQPAQDGQADPDAGTGNGRVKRSAPTRPRF